MKALENNETLTYKFRVSYMQDTLSVNQLKKLTDISKEEAAEFGFKLDGYEMIWETKFIVPDGFRLVKRSDSEKLERLEEWNKAMQCYSKLLFKKYEQVPSNLKSKFIGFEILAERIKQGW